MFDWLKKRKSPTPQDTEKRESPSPQDTEAFKTGQKAAQSMAADLDAFMTARFDPVFNGYLATLRDCLDKALVVEGKEEPPIMHAQVQYQSFVGFVDEMRPDMLAEIRAAMEEWISLCDQVDVGETTNRLFEHRADQFASDLKLAGLSETLQLKTDFPLATDCRLRQNGRHILR